MHIYKLQLTKPCMVPILHKAAHRMFNLLASLSCFENNKTLIEIYFKYTPCSNQKVHLSACGLKPFYYAAKLNEPCENHLPLSQLDFFFSEWECSWVGLCVLSQKIINTELEGYKCKQCILFKDLSRKNMFKYLHIYFFS